MYLCNVISNNKFNQKIKKMDKEFEERIERKKNACRLPRTLRKARNENQGKRIDAMLEDLSNLLKERE